MACMHAAAPLSGNACPCGREDMRALRGSRRQGGSRQATGTQGGDSRGALCAVLPVNLASPKKLKASAVPSQALTSTFARLTISNLERGSQDYWWAITALLVEHLKSPACHHPLCSLLRAHACAHRAPHAQVRLRLPDNLDGVCVLAPRQVLPGDRPRCHCQGWTDLLPHPAPCAESGRTHASIEQASSEYAACCAQSYVILRQNYLMGGEEQINLWHQHFLEARQKAAGTGGGPSSRPGGKKARTIFSNLNPRAQVCDTLACPGAVQQWQDSLFC